MMNSFNVGDIINFEGSAKKYKILKMTEGISSSKTLYEFKDLETKEEFSNFDNGIVLNNSIIFEKYYDSKIIK